jgi:signal peptide peptidase SppA
MIEEKIWAGSETSLQAATEALVKLEASDREEEPCEYPRLLSVDGGLATITIKGPLVNMDHPMLKWYGMTGYPEIRDALLNAVNDPEVKQILLEIDSGGGQVAGCDDTGNLIRAVHKVKPVTTYSDTMASAAYWLGCSAGKVYSSKAALVGSIGVIATFKEYSKQNEMEGVTVSIIRAGKYKALANQNEPLSKEARAQIQAMADAAYGVFVEHVADMRGVDYATCDKKMADGQEFIGQAAADVGLTDGITTFDAVVGGLKKKILASSQKSTDNRVSNRFRLSGTAQTSGDSPMAKKSLTEADIAALAAGATLDAEGTATQELEGVLAAASKGAQDALQAETPSEEVTQAEVRPEPVASSDTSVQFLQSMVKDKDEALIAANVKIAKLEEKLADVEAAHAPLLAIAVKSARNMATALNGTSLLSEGMAAVQVLAEHQRITELFKTKFPIGGVAAVTAEETPAKTQIDPRHRARVNAVRFQK